MTLKIISRVYLCIIIFFLPNMFEKPLDICQKKSEDSDESSCNVPLANEGNTVYIPIFLNSDTVAISITLSSTLLSIASTWKIVFRFFISYDFP